MARGFTLVETIVVLAIIGVLATVSTPSLLSYWQSAAVEAGARELAGVINLARQLAISRRTLVCVDVASTHVQLRLGGCSGRQWTGPATDRNGVIRLADDQTVWVSANAQVVFTPLGAATPSGSYTVTHARTRESRAVVVAASGRITIQ
jgi:type IV fimbrial biogenesis protein FimT